MFRPPSIQRFSVTIGISALALAYQVATATAFQPDAPFLAHQEKNKAKWVQEDEIIDEKFGFYRERHAIPYE